VRPPSKLALGIPVLAAGIAAALIGTGSPARAASPVNYVALGDSYSSGIGAGSTSGSCGQSPNAYPALWAKANSPAVFKFAACSGATTTGVINSQLPSLRAATTLVSVTTGGNDAGFSSVMETCVLKSTSSCESAVAAGEKIVTGTLPGRLDAMLAGIHADAPDAKVVILGYPDFYDLNAWLCLGLSSADRSALNAGINELDGVLQAAAARGGATFADVRGQFAGHEICDGAGWLHSVTYPIGDSYHPTATGQQNGYLPAMTAAARAVGQAEPAE
jgi:lysophospholipase L1-like esterase